MYFSHKNIEKSKFTQDLKIIPCTSTTSPGPTRCDIGENSFFIHRRSACRGNPHQGEDVQELLAGCK